MYVSTSFQRIRLREVHTYADLHSTPLIINFESVDQDNEHGEIVFHLENAPLARALVNAINATLKSFEALSKTPAEEAA